MIQLLLYWQRTVELDDNLIFKKAATNQECFIRDDIAGHLLHINAFVVSSHHSKSCKLPVYYMKLRNGIKVILRGNFYDWKMSIEIPQDKPSLPRYYLPKDCLSWYMVDNKDSDTTSETDAGSYKTIPTCYLEGFKNEWAYVGYNPEKPANRFTIEVPTDEDLYVVFHYLKHAYPEEQFNVDSDKRSVDEIKNSIDKIINHFGVNDYDANNDRVMEIHDILSSTEFKIFKSDIDISYNDRNNSDVYAKIIFNNPEIHEVFLREEQVFIEAMNRFKD